jgi:hypothetical protein
MATLLVDLVGQRFLLRVRRTSLIGLVGQRFLPRVGPASLAGLLCQRFLPRGGPLSLVGLVRDVIAFNLGQDGVERSSEESALYPNAPDCRALLLALLILGQCLLPRGRLTSLVGLVSQCFLPRSGLTLLIGLVGQCIVSRSGPALFVGLVGQRFLLRGRLVVTSLLGKQLLGQRRSAVGRLRHSAIPRRIALRHPGKELDGGREAKLGHVSKLVGTEGSLPTISLVSRGGKRLGVRVVLLPT